jgi:hypothetical protein
MVRLISLLIIASVLYYIWAVTQSNKEQSIEESYGFTPSIITVEELPPIREENE